MAGGARPYVMRVPPHLLSGPLFIWGGTVVCGFTAVQECPSLNWLLANNKRGWQLGSCVIIIASYSASKLMEVYMQTTLPGQYETVRTTVTLPTTLLQRSQEFVDSGRIPNRNALIVAAIERFVADLEREAIDRQFAALAEDADYQTLQTDMTESFADSDWEALTQAEQVAV